MNQQELQRTRYVLQMRFRRIKAAPIGNFEQVCQQVLTWLEAHPILNSVLHHLDSVPGEHHDEIARLLALEHTDNYRNYHREITQTLSPERPNFSKFKGYTATTLEEHASACLLIIRAVIERPEMNFYSHLAIYLTKQPIDDRDDQYEAMTIKILKDRAVNDLYEYIDEHLDGINGVNGILLRYKQNAEWFEREMLQGVLEGARKKHTGERSLAYHLQKYVFNQGIEYSIEQASVSGEVDLLLRGPSGDYTIIDAKYIPPDAPRSIIIKKIASGFNQVARYCEDYNQHQGFLVVFIDDDIVVTIDIEQSDGFKYFKVGGNIIYYLEVNISLRASASKSGKATPVHISQDDLTTVLENTDQDGSDINC